MKDSYRTVKGEARMEYRVKDSRFVATLFPVSSREEVHTSLQSVQQEFPGASHHVYAYNYYQEGGLISMESDDGEPAGSSGPPLAAVLKRTGLKNLLVVVTRFFGGTKLGLGGLSRAYQEAGRRVLQSGEVVVVISYYPLQVEVAYPLLGEVLKVVDRFCKIQNVTEKEGKALVVALIRGRDLTQFQEALLDASRGQALLRVQGKKDPADVEGI